MHAVVLDLFGTLVDAPASTDRSHTAARLARVIGCDPATVVRYFLASWQIRHDGTLPTVEALARHMVRTVGGPTSVVGTVTDKLRARARARLVPDASVTHALISLRLAGYRIGVLSDASADIAAAWPGSPLATIVDAAVLSCATGCTKPDQRLYARISDTLGVAAHQVLYCGDGGGDELQGAVDHGMSAVAVRRRGAADALVFGDKPWPGPNICSVERLQEYLAARR